MPRAAPLLLLTAVTAVWGVTFVQVKDAVAIYPLFAFLAVRFALAAVALAPFALPHVRRLPTHGWRAGLGVGSLLALSYGLQTAGLELTTVSSTGFITGLYVVFTPLLALVLWGTRVPGLAWGGVALSVGGLALLTGFPSDGSLVGNLLVLANAFTQSAQIAFLERFAPRYHPLALTFVQMALSAVAFLAIAVALGDLSVPRGATVWSALLVTAVFASALGYLVQSWVQARTTAARAALVFTLEAPWAALFGVWLDGDDLGLLGWLGCGVMLAGILLAEPAAASVLRRFAGRRVPR